MDKILIRGARTHNLKNIDLTLPRDKLIVITGLSGSGKSSLAFDTLYAEGQRRYVESLSAYARQFLSMMEKPDVDTIEGLSPAISIEQKSTSHNPRSTVGTITEIYDYLRLLYARVGTPRCPDHDIPLEAQTVSQMVDLVLERPEGSKLMLLAPVVRDKKGEHLHLFDQLRAQLFLQIGLTLHHNIARPRRHQQRLVRMIQQKHPQIRSTRALQPSPVAVPPRMGINLRRPCTVWPTSWGVPTSTRRSAKNWNCGSGKGMTSDMGPSVSPVASSACHPRG